MTDRIRAAADRLADLTVYDDEAVVEAAVAELERAEDEAADAMPSSTGGGCYE
jgi:hypothetical protein